MKPQVSRQIHLYSLLILAFTLPVINSVLHLRGSLHFYTATNLRMVYRICYELVSLGLLAWILRRQGRKFESIGLFPPNFRDLWHSILLIAGTLIGARWAYVFLQILYRSQTGHWDVPTGDYKAQLFGNDLIFFPMVFALINPFFEELVVRAYLITEIAGIYSSTIAAVVASVALQASYHLYQGVVRALSLGVCFSVYTWYYARKRRILPVILAHMYMDVWALVYYLYNHPIK